jgi:hypothetical protein
MEKVAQRPPSWLKLRKHKKGQEFLFQNPPKSTILSPEM